MPTWRELQATKNCFHPIESSRIARELNTNLGTKSWAAEAFPEGGSAVPEAWTLNRLLPCYTFVYLCINFVMIDWPQWKTWVTGACPNHAPGWMRVLFSVHAFLWFSDDPPAFGWKCSYLPASPSCLASSNKFCFDWTICWRSVSWRHCLVGGSQQIGPALSFQNQQCKQTSYLLLALGPLSSLGLDQSPELRQRSA